MKGIQFKGTTTDGSPTRTRISTYEIHHHRVVYIQQVALINQHDENIWLESGYTLLKRFKERSLIFREMAYKLETLTNIINGVQQLLKDDN